MPDEAPPPQPDAADSHANAAIQDPPTTLGGILKQLGPGLIIAGSIVGSGELIATTAVGAEAGFVLMWLIILGCLVKVFVQIEFGKYTIIHGKTTLDGMNEVPGPRFGGPRHRRINWICWFWLVFIVVALAQLGGIIGGVGQAVTIQAPLTEQGRITDEYQSLDIRLDVIEGLIDRFENEPDQGSRVEELNLERERVESELFDLVDLDPVLQRELAYRVYYAGLIASLKDMGSISEDDGGFEEKVLAAIDAGITETWGEINLSDRQQAHIHLVALRYLIDVLEADEAHADAVQQLQAQRSSIETWKRSPDPAIWATIITLGSIVILVLGRYRLIQNVSTALVAMFTFVTIGNLIVLQTLPEWRVNWSDVAAGMSFNIPPGAGLATALAAFGIIGVGATELIQYPYWCLEKGYAKWTGPRDDSDAWARRAEGWLRVLKWDAWASMVVYTFATIAFYLLGAAILSRSGLNPDGATMVRTLGEMYVPVFGDWAQAVFLFGAIAVLYSTFFVATASHARVLADAMRVFGLSRGGEQSYIFWTRIFCGTLPLLFLATFVFVSSNPKQLVLAGGFMGALMLPLLGVTALYGRYCRGDQRLRPNIVWDIFLWISVVGLFTAGGWALYTKIIQPLL